MSISGNSNFECEDEPLVNDINMTPFIDVMLVLLIVFMITLPVVNHAVKVQLPKGVANTVDHKNNFIDISINKDGDIYFNKKIVTEDSLKEQLLTSSQSSNKPSIRIYADKESEYQKIAFVMSSAQEVGLSKFDFVISQK